MYVIEKNVDPTPDTLLTWSFVQDYTDADKAAWQLESLREKYPQNHYRLIEEIDA